MRTLMIYLLIMRRIQSGCIDTARRRINSSEQARQVFICRPIFFSLNDELLVPISGRSARCDPLLDIDHGTYRDPPSPTLRECVRLV